MCDAESDPHSGRASDSGQRDALNKTGSPERAHAVCAALTAHEFMNRADAALSPLVFVSVTAEGPGLAINFPIG